MIQHRHTSGTRDYRETVSARLADRQPEVEPRRFPGSVRNKKTRSIETRSRFESPFFTVEHSGPRQYRFGIRARWRILEHVFRVSFRD